LHGAGDAAGVLPCQQDSRLGHRLGRFDQLRRNFDAPPPARQPSVSTTRDGLRQFTDTLLTEGLEAIVSLNGTVSATATPKAQPLREARTIRQHMSRRADLAADAE
jgi:hypothetical protein